MAYIGSCLAQCMERAEQRSLVVKGFTCIRDKDSRDAKGIIDDKDGRCRVLCRIATSLEGIADASIRERAGIWFLLNEQLA